VEKVKATLLTIGSMLGATAALAFFAQAPVFFLLALLGAWWTFWRYEKLPGGG
jgi:hypothetical protein